MIIPQSELPSPSYVPISAVDLLRKFDKIVLDTGCDEVPIS
jgi:hypothetical protein